MLKNKINETMDAFAAHCPFGIVKAPYRRFQKQKIIQKNKYFFVAQFPFCLAVIRFG